MAKIFTEKELESIRKVNQQTCISLGINPMIDSPYGKIVNPAYSNCIQKEYQKAIDAGNENKLNLWLDKTKSFVEAQGGFMGLLENASNLSTAYQKGYEKGKAGQYTQQGDANQFGNPNTKDEKSINLSVWIGIIVLIIVLIIFAIFYFRNKSK